MKFRAVLRGVEGLERPVQCFGPTKASLEDWVQEALARHPGAWAEIYQIGETLVGTYRASAKGEESHG